MKKALIFFLFIFLVWTTYRYFSHFPEWVDEIFVKSLTYMLPTLFVTKILEKRSLQSLGFSSKSFFTHVAIGLAAASLLICYDLVLHSLATHSFLAQFTTSFSIQTLLVFIVSFFTAFTEELVFRGYILTRILEQTKSPWIAIGLSTVLFSILHVPRAVFVLHFSPIQIFAYLWSLCFLGTINGVVFWKTKSLTSSATIHTIWNFVQVVAK